VSEPDELQAFAELTAARPRAAARDGVEAALEYGRRGLWGMAVYVAGRASGRAVADALGAVPITTAGQLVVALDAQTAALARIRAAFVHGPPEGAPCD
jgi:hypothetical protein